MYLLGIDVGSSFIKASILDITTGKCVGAGSSPDVEMEIICKQSGFAEQHPHIWWENAVKATKKAYTQAGISSRDIKAVGISYQMHGLVLLNQKNEVIRPAIIWCDSRAVDIGKKAFESIGKDACLTTMLNSPGNFTASKLKWVKDNEPENFKQIHKFCLPGDYIAQKLTDKITTTVSGLSEGIMWDFSQNSIAKTLLAYYGIPESFIPDIVPTFGFQGELSTQAAQEIGLAAGTPVSYRAGDQPNNAFSLNVLEPGEIAATAGTSGVIYGVTNTTRVDASSRVNAFAHVNHSTNNNRLGILLCVNGTGIANAWTKRLLGESFSYAEMNDLANQAPIGSDGLVVLPFGNGAERILENKDPGAHIVGLQFNRHSKAHICRAIQEGIACALMYGLDIMKGIGVNVTRIRAGKSNMFLSPVFGETICGISNVPIDLYNTDGAQGAARGAGVGANLYSDFKTACAGLAIVETITPQVDQATAFASVYKQWKDVLEKTVKI